MTPIQRFREIKLKNIIANSENFQSHYQSESTNKRLPGNQEDIVKTNEKLGRKESIKIIIDPENENEILKAEFNQYKKETQ